VTLVGGVYVRDLRSAELGDWPRKGVKGAAVYLDGDDPCDAHLVEIPPGRSTAPEHHLYDEGIRCRPEIALTRLGLAELLVQGSPSSGR